MKRVRERVRVSSGRVQITCTGKSMVSNIRVGSDWIVRPEPWYVRLLNRIRSLFV